MFNPMLSLLAAQNAQRAAQGALLASQMAVQNAQRAAQATAAQQQAGATPEAGTPDVSPTDTNPSTPGDGALGMIVGLVVCLGTVILMLWLLGGL